MNGTRAVLPKGRSVIVDVHGRVVGPLTGEGSSIPLRDDQMSPYLRNAVVAIEDRRFYRNSGVDLRGIARALVRNVRARRVVEGGSTITQQLIKNHLGAFERRTVWQKVRETVLALRFTRSHSKSAILTYWLNIVYFGNGAHGAEAAARTYFRKTLGEEEPVCARLAPHQAALIAGAAACPSLYDPATHPGAARGRRDDVLRAMRREGYLSDAELELSLAEPIPRPAEIELEEAASVAPYFTSWIRRHVIDRIGAKVAFDDGVTVHSTLDLDMQRAAAAAVADATEGTGLVAAVVLIDNESAEVRALVGGRDYGEQPWNLATQAQHPPGGALDPLARALGRPGGSEEVVEAARAAGVRTTATAGFPQGVTPVDVAAVYLTASRGGVRTSGTLASPVRGTVGVRAIAGAAATDRNAPSRERAMDAGTAAAFAAQLKDTGEGARLHVASAPAGGWAVGFDARFTAAVWIGSPGHDAPVAEAPARAERAWRAIMTQPTAARDYPRGGSAARGLPESGLPSVSRSFSQKRRRPSAWW